MPAIVKDSRILLVDDSVIMRGMIRGILADFGYKNIDEAENGIVALEKIQKAKERNNLFRVIFLDWAMPEMNGLSFLEKCRADSEMSGVAIIMLTAVSERSDMVMAIKKGATGYITKPFEPNKVSEALTQASAWAEKIGHD